MPKRLLAPSGRIITSISSHAFQGEIIRVDDDGTFAGDGFGDFPHFTAWEYGGANLVVDTEGSEFLATHCRTVTVPEDFDDWLDEPFAPWPGDIIQICFKAAWYAAGALILEAGRSWLPTEMREDTTVAAVFDNILIGRARGMADSLSAQVAAWRLNNPDVTHIPDPDEESEDAEA